MKFTLKKVIDSDQLAAEYIESANGCVTSSNAMHIIAIVASFNESRKKLFWEAVEKLAKKETAEAS